MAQVTEAVILLANVCHFPAGMPEGLAGYPREAERMFGIQYLKILRMSLCTILGKR